MAAVNNTTGIGEDDFVHNQDLPSIDEIQNGQNSSFTIFFVLFILFLTILLIHFLIKLSMYYLPESISVIFLGAVIGLILKVMSIKGWGDWTECELFDPTIFFLVFLPPIIFEAGYSLHKGNFFQNIGSILLLAIVGTAISAFTMGLGIYALGEAGVVYKLGFFECFAFGSLISAVDPVATLAIFQALDCDQMLYMLVFGESILNDAVAIVLTHTVLNLAKDETSTKLELFFIGVSDFLSMFFVSALMGILIALASALILKHVNLRNNPSLEFGFMLIFAYMPYCFAEGLHYSGIMSVLFTGITMSHYTHFNLSPVTQITVQQTFRTASFLAENCVFAYLGLAIFSYHHEIEVSLIVWMFILLLVSRAVNIFPLSFILNFFRDHKITKKMQLVMWFAGLRGAIAFAISLNLDLHEKNRHVIVTATLILVLLSTLLLGGGTMPIIKLIGDVNDDELTCNYKNIKKEITLSKTDIDTKMECKIYAQAMPDQQHDPTAINFVRPSRLAGMAALDELYLMPFFRRHLSIDETDAGTAKLLQLAKQWHETLAQLRQDNLANSETDLGLSADIEETLFNETTPLMEHIGTE